MGWKSFAVRPFASLIARKIGRDSRFADRHQRIIFESLINSGRRTSFGRDHKFSEVASYEDFKQAVPIRDYEGLRPYIDRIKKGEKNVLWPGLPKYFAKTSGTTSGIKYIPLTHDSIPNHLRTAQMAALNYFNQKPDTALFDGKVIFLGGSPVLENVGGIPTGRLSGIVNLEVPGWIKGNQLPSYQTNCIEDWEAKVDRIVEETHRQDMRLISGIPPWVQMYFERLVQATGKKTVIDVFPNFNLFMYGGVNYEPYRSSIEELMGKKVDSIELFPASEGFIAFQDKAENDGLLLNTNSGIFFEFIRLSEYSTNNFQRLSLQEVALNEDYVLIINNNAGLWGYNLGDTVRFTSLRPYKIKVSGRVKHYISAFGEHVIGAEVEGALAKAVATNPCTVIEFTVAPNVSPSSGSLPHHEWLVEFGELPENMERFVHTLDAAMCELNIYYKDLIDGRILRPLTVSVLEKDAFRQYMRQSGKLGGQNKVPRLSNDRNIADGLQNFIVRRI